MGFSFFALKLTTIIEGGAIMNIINKIAKKSKDKIFDKAFIAAVQMYNKTIMRMHEIYYGNDMSIKTDGNDVTIVFNMDLDDIDNQVKMFNIKDVERRYFKWLLQRECDRLTKNKKYRIIPNNDFMLAPFKEIIKGTYEIEKL
jgi:hypothetical protein